MGWQLTGIASREQTCSKSPVLGACTVRVGQ